MDERRTVRVSKYLAKHLRHQPERIGLSPDPAGWVEIDALIAAAADHGFPFTREELDHVVAANDKRRFAVEGTRIRASQGHTIPVDLQLPPAVPLTWLYHGTVARNLDVIRAEGLRPMSRSTPCISPPTARPPPVSAPVGDGRWCCRSTRAPCTVTAMSSASAPTASG